MSDLQFWMILMSIFCVGITASNKEWASLLFSVLAFIFLVALLFGQAA